MSKKSILQFIFISFVFAALTAGTALAQGNAFSFQGRLNDGTSAATVAGTMKIFQPQGRWHCPQLTGMTGADW